MKPSLLYLASSLLQGTLHSDAELCRGIDATSPAMTVSISEQNLVRSRMWLEDEGVGDEVPVCCLNDHDIGFWADE